VAVFFEKWMKGLAKTREALAGRASCWFGGGSADAARIEDLETALIAADAGPEVAAELIRNLKSAAGSGVPGAESARAILKREILSLVRADDPPSGPENGKPRVILMVGVNGAGKTTTVGKLAHRFRSEGKSVVVAGADTFRAAADAQLAAWADRSGAAMIGQTPGADPASVAFDALDHAVRRGADVLIVDTAGRLHTKANLMAELGKIRRVLSKRMASAPHETLLVLDATTGQNGLRQAEAFTRTAGVTGIVLAKLDGTAKGGAVLAVRRATGIPVRWVGVGESIGDLLPFDAEAFAEGILGEVGSGGSTSDPSV
jgi:fused signal recognition particle receptor